METLSMGVTSSDLSLRIITLLQKHTHMLGILVNLKKKKIKDKQLTEREEAMLVIYWLPSLVSWDFLCGAMNRVGGMAAPSTRQTGVELGFWGQREGWQDLPPRLNCLCCPSWWMSVTLGIAVPSRHLHRISLFIDSRSEISERLKA